uniref:Gamma-butyrobetaine hydroxylase-like N-terminal domain-containing protein n=1 Tax=Trypanosoma congolense (strain IL3000) TaxID=1068625 RepID=G0UV80_TRYCI|nr:conserved hypothetical protein [Trypanosoma congolense IL3000]
MRRVSTFSTCPCSHAWFQLHAQHVLIGWRYFTILVDRLSTAVAQRLSSVTDAHMVPLSDKHITELRRPYPKRPSMQESLAERVAQQKRWRMHLVPSQIVLTKDRLYMELVWSAAALNTVAEQEMQIKQLEGERCTELGETCCIPNSEKNKGSCRTSGTKLAATPPTAHRMRFLAEFLRAYSPSTDVVGSDVLIYGRRGLTITDVIPVGGYALRIVFSDGHAGGIYPYEYLFHLGNHKYAKMREYIRRLREKRKSRDPPRRVPSKYNHRSIRAVGGQSNGVEGEERGCLAPSRLKSE